MDSGPSKRKGSLHDWSDAGSPAPGDAVGDAVGNEFVGARDDGRVDGHVDDVAPSDEVLLDAMQKTNILRLVSAAPNLVTAWCAMYLGTGGMRLILQANSRLRSKLWRLV
jgi:hypothetical protein